MRKLFSILFVFALTLGFVAGEKRIVGARVNNQIMLLRVDLANYSMDASTDGANWNAIPGTSGIADNALSLSKLAQVSTGSILGNVSGSTGNVTTLSASDLKTLIGNATTSSAGLMSSTDKTKLDGIESGGASSVADLTDVSLTSLATGNGLVYESGTGTTKILSHFNNSLSDEVGSALWSIMSGLDAPSYAAGKFGNAVVFNGNSGIYHSSIEHLYNLSAFTMEAWFYPTGFSDDAHILGIYEEISVTLLSSGKLGIWVHNGSSELQVGSTGTTTLSADTWYHIRLVRNGSDFYLYLNGVLECSGTSSVRSTAPENDRKLTIGALGVGHEGYNRYTGRTDEFHLLNEALIGDFTPATAPYTVPSGIWRNQMIIASPASTAQGDILYYSGSAWAKQSIGSAGQVLAVNSGATGYEFTTPTGGLLKASGSGYALDNGSTGRGTIGTKSVSLEYSNSGSTYGATGANATVSGGLNNTASGINSTVSGGADNAASGTDSTVGGGYSNIASGNKSTVSGGAQNTASGTHSTVIGGLSNTASGNYSTAGGTNGISSHHGENSYSSGAIVSTGDCQRGSIQARISTSSTDATILYLDGTSARFTLSAGDHYSCRVHLIGAQSDGSTGDYYALVKIKNVSGTTSLSGTVRVLETWEGDTNLGTPTISITADDTNDALQIAVTPANATATRWTAVIEYVKINY